MSCWRGEDGAKIEERTRAGTPGLESSKPTEGTKGAKRQAQKQTWAHAIVVMVWYGGVVGRKKTSVG
jgi:hypothetical protein